MSKHTITMKEIQNMINNGITTFSKKDDSPRGCKTVAATEIQMGDKVGETTKTRVVGIATRSYTKHHKHLDNWIDFAPELWYTYIVAISNGHNIESRWKDGTRRYDRKRTYYNNDW